MQRAGEPYLADLAYANSREVRLFDEYRYTQSLLLPEIIRSIGGRRCFHTGHDNFFTVELIDGQGSELSTRSTSNCRVRRAKVI